MPDDNFQTNLGRLIAAELYFLVAMTAAREMLGKSYFSLGAAEKIAVDQAVFGSVGGNYQTLTAEFLKGQQPGQIGFQAIPPSQPSK